MAILKLSGSVGAGSAKSGNPHNQADDVARVRDRFIELGYSWLGGVKTGKEKEFIEVINLFQSTCAGSGKADKGDGRIDRHGSTHRWLAAVNAPGWVEVRNKSGIGWESTPDLEYGDKKNSHATTWLVERINSAGFWYRAKSLMTVASAPPLWIRDCSPAKGGEAKGHKSHETGLDVDMRLPLLPPYTRDWTRLGPHDYTRKFHFEAAVTQLEAIKSSMDARYVFFNDPRCIKKRLCTDEPNHGNHYHIRIKPPERIEGGYL